MKKSIAFLTLFLMLAVFCLPAGAAGGRYEGLDVRDVPAEVPASMQEWEVLRIVNVERMSEGLLPLTMFLAMQTAADIRALEITQSFSHTRPDGTDCFTVLDEVGVDWCAVGENIAAGQPTPAAVMQSWMNSPGHRANILNSSFTHIGVGYEYRQGTAYGAYWVQVFCRGWDCAYTSFEILGELDQTSAVDGLGLAGKFTCGEGYCYMPLTSAMVTGDVTQNGVRTVTFSCFGLTAAISSYAAPSLPGDVNGSGEVDVADALLTMRYAMGIVDLTPEQILLADVSGNGVVEVSDALIIMRMAMGII